MRGQRHYHEHHRCAIAGRSRSRIQLLRGAHAPAARPATFVYHPNVPAAWRCSRIQLSPCSVRLCFALFGALDSSEISSAGIEIADAAGVLRTGRLPAPAQHDAQGAELGGDVYVFGGGSITEASDHIISFDPARGAVRTVGALPRAVPRCRGRRGRSTAYVVGGYDGTEWLNTLLAWRPGSPVRVAGHLPGGLRYSAETAAGGRIPIIGGSAPGGASSAIYSLDPPSGRVRQSAAAAADHPRVPAVLGAFVYLVGGRERSWLSHRLSVDRSAHRRRRGRGTASRAAVGHCLGGDRRKDRRRRRADARRAQSRTWASSCRNARRSRCSRPGRLDSADVVADGLELRRAQPVGDGHLSHELEHLGTGHVQGEEIATLSAWRLLSGERMARPAILRKQRGAAGILRAATGPGTRREP